MGDLIKLERHFICPECGNFMELMHIAKPEETASGLEERVYACCSCGSAWSDMVLEDGSISKLKRYFIG